MNTPLTYNDMSMTQHDIKRKKYFVHFLNLFVRNINTQTYFDGNFKKTYKSQGKITKKAKCVCNNTLKML